MLKLLTGHSGKLLFGRNVARCLLSVLIAVLGGPTVAAMAQTSSQIQQLQDLTPEQLQKLQSLQKQQGTNPQQVLPPPVVLTPAPQTRGKPATSELERITSARLGQTVHQFGYDQVGVGASVSVPQTGAVQDNYVLGPGDQLDVSLRGQENSTYAVVVDRNGQVTLPKLSPIPAAGRTLGDFRQDLMAAVHKAYVSTEGFVSVGQLRQVSVMVTGDVDNPGVRIVTGLSSPLDAILLSGGVNKSGSLRNIKLIRNGEEITIDLYGILTQQASAPLINLRDGDRILVPPIGATVAVAGFARRPAIYELPAGQKAISLQNLVALASGPTVPGAYAVSVLRLMPDGKRQFVDVTNAPRTMVRDGEAVVLRSTVDVSLGQATLVGAVRSPGAFALDKYPTLHDILPSADALQPGAYVLMGVIERIDPATMQREVLPFSPLHVVHGSENVKLASNDTVRILTDDAMCRILLVGIQGESQVARPFGRPASPPIAPENCQASSAAGAGAPTTSPSGPSGTRQAGRGAAATGVPANGNLTQAGAEMPGSQATGQGGAEVAQSGSGEAVAAGSSQQTAAAAESAGGVPSADASLVGAALSDYRVDINGAVHRAGTYLVAPGTTVAEALIAAHGLADDADLSSFEITSTRINNETGTATTLREQYGATADQLKRIVVRPFDSVIFRHVYADTAGGVVHIAGEVRYPGNYDILRGERLSSLLMRAGGLTDVAYPYGTVFLRQSVARREEEGNRREIDDIRSQLVVAMVRPTGSNAAPLSPETAAALQGLLKEFESQPALGRISVIADPAVLAARPNRDPILEPGDSVTIPKRPSTVTVLGQVMQPGSFPFDSSLSTSDYVERAGGFSQFADSSRVVVVLPDGTARLSERSWLGFGGGGAIPPGSVIVVPRDLESLSIHQLIVDTTQILSQLATTAAALAVLSKY